MPMGWLLYRFRQKQRTELRAGRSPTNKGCLVHHFSISEMYLLSECMPPVDLRQIIGVLGLVCAYLKRVYLPASKMLDPAE